MSFQEIHEINLKDISKSELNVRKDIRNATRDLDKLAASINQHGLLQPVVLRGKYGNCPYELIAGQRRFLAHQNLELETIRSVFTGKITDTKAIVLSLIENMQSVDLNHADTAAAITQLYKQSGNDQRKVQKLTGLAIQTIREYLTIDSQASAKMKRLLKEKKVEKVDVKRALRAAQGDIKKAEELLDFMCEYPLTQHQKKRIVEYGTHDQRASAETILEKAMQPRVEENILVSLREDVRQGLEQATKDLEQGAEEIVAEVLHDWLCEQGFIDE